MREIITPVSDTGRADPVGARMDADRKVREELWEADERLRALVRAFEDKPSTIDAAMNTADRAVSAEAAVIGTFRLLRTRVYTEDSPLRSDVDIWEAFCAQQEEFARFYRSALTALEAYREVLHAYDTIKRRSAPPQPGDLDRIRRDKHVHIEERDACIQALTYFQAKFSAMLAVLSPVVLP